MKNTILAVLCGGLLAVGCGGSDGSDGGGGGGASSSGAAGGAGKGGTSSAGASSSAGSTSRAGASNVAGASSSAGSSNSGDCVLEDALVSCYKDVSGGVAVCTETAVAGTSVEVVKSQCGGTVKENEHCPTNATLVGYCKGGVTTFYYAPQSNNVWANIGASCEATMGTWCGQ